MVQLFRFQAGRFDPDQEDPNPINPIPGQAPLRWLGRELGTRGFVVNEPDVEDWGWYVYVDAPDARFLLGASGEAAAPGRVDWTLQLHRRRSLWERLRGLHVLRSDDPLVREIESLLRAQPDFSGVELESDG